METFTMSSKEAPRPGLLKAALAGRIGNEDAARALAITVRLSFAKSRPACNWLISRV